MAQLSMFRLANERKKREPARVAPKMVGLSRPRALDARVTRQIFGTRAESQRIVATRPLCRAQYPVPYSSRLQGIHRAGSVNCDRSRLVRYGMRMASPARWTAFLPAWILT